MLPPSALLGPGLHPIACAHCCRIDHEIKGSSIYAFVSLADGHKFSDAIKKDLSQTVRQQIGAFAVPDVIHWAPGLPKARLLASLQPVL